MSALRPDLVTNLGVCPAPELLRQHLSGWLSESESEEIERHLSECSACEAAALQFEPGHDTLMQSLQATVGQPGQNDVTTSVDGGSAAEQLPVASEESPISVAPESIKSSPIEAPIEAAIDRARRLLDAPLQTESERSHRDWNPPQRELGIYELLKPLGRGGMGAVYLARHRQLGKQVAIKLLPVMSAEDSDVRTRFDREIRVVGRLNHPSIVAATDAGEIEGTQFLVMEYVPGLDLSRLARLMGRLPIADACELIRQASLGLSCAHAEGVVHRDIKPSNLMLDDQGRIRILDFGLAQWTVWDEASVDLTTVGQLMGTLDYVAPEQAEAVGSVDYRADLYALGATLFRLLCGRAPLAAAPNQSPLEKLRLLANHQPPKLSTLCPEAPEELVKLVASLLSRRPSDRPASAAHVAEQLAPFAEGSKLVDLLKQAKEKAATSPELLKKSAFPDHPPFLSSAPASLAPLPASSGGGRSRIFRRLLLAASLPILIIAGILIKLETSKGQLVIESDVDNVSVKLLKDGKPVDGIQVSHGTTSTRLNADNYEITIDGPSDGLVIDNEKFTLKNGETVVARIRREGDRPSSGVSESAALQHSDGLEVRTAAASLREDSVILQDSVLQWLETVQLPNSDEVKADVVAFMEDVRQLQRSQGRESKPGELRSALDKSVESWKGIYRHLGQCRTVERGKLSATAGEIRLGLTELDYLIPKADSSELIASDQLYDGQPLSDPLAAMRQKVLELDVDLRLKEKTLGPSHPTVLALKDEIKIRVKQLDTAMSELDVAHLALQPLYNGQPLEHWLDMLSRERSVLGLKAAIEGCTALVAEDNAGAVTDALLKTLPGLDGELQVIDKETNSVWTLDYSADGLLRKANPGSRYFEVWVKARSQSTDKKWNERLLKLANQRASDSPDDLAPLIEWGRIVLSETSSSQDPGREKQAAIDAAVLLRNFSGINYFGTKQPFVDFVAPILTESPMLDDRWWISEPLVYREFKGELSEVWPAPIKAKITETAVRVLERVDSDPSMVVQACIILANGAVLTEEQKTAVLTSVQRRLDDASMSPETLTEMVPLIGAFSNMALPNVGSSNGLGFVAPRIQVSNSFAASVRDTDASLVLQLLNVVTAIDSDKRCQPQVRKIFESSRDVFEILNAQRLAEIEGRANTMTAQFGLRLPDGISLDFTWPSLTTNVDHSTPIHPGNPDGFQAMAFRMLWGEHKPSKQDWLKYLILLHPAMQDVVTAEIEKAGGAEAEK